MEVGVCIYLREIGVWWMRPVPGSRAFACAYVCFCCVCVSVCFLSPVCYSFCVVCLCVCVCVVCVSRTSTIRRRVSHIGRHHTHHFLSITAVQQCFFFFHVVQIVTVNRYVCLLFFISQNASSKYMYIILFFYTPFSCVCLCDFFFLFFAERRDFRRDRGGGHVLTQPPARAGHPLQPTEATHESGALHVHRGDLHRHQPLPMARHLRKGVVARCISQTLG